MTNEAGTLASEAIAELFDEVGKGQPDRGAALWQALVGSEWPSAAQIDDGPDDTIDLRAIQSIARVTGRQPAVTPIASTLLATTWNRDRELEAERGIVIALPRDGASVALDVSDGSLLASAAGVQEAPEPVAVDTFVPSSRTATYAVEPVTGRQLDEARAVYAAIAVGCADAALAKAVTWAATRTQFGQPIAKFQAVRHHLADAHIAREQAWTAAIAAGAQPDDSARWAGLAARLARRTIDLAIQVHGGVGFTVEVGLHHFLDRVIEIEATVGGAR